jgi:hypothetical protein
MGKRSKANLGSLARASSDADPQLHALRKFTPEVRKALLFGAARGWAKCLIAPFAGISEETLRLWLLDEREPLAAFAVEFNRAHATAGGELSDEVRATKPEYLLGAVFKIKASDKTEITGKDGKDLFPSGRELTDDELLAKARALTRGDTAG